MKHTIVDEVRYDIYRRVLAACFENPKCPDPQSAIGTAGMVTGLAVEDLIKAGVIKAERDYSQEVMDKIDSAEVGGKASDQVKHLDTKEDRKRTEYRGVAPR